MSDAPAPLSRYAQFAALAGDVCLMLGLLAWHGYLAPTGLGIGLGLALCIPLLLPLPGLLRAKSYTHAWASLMVMLYIAYALTEFLANPQPRAVLPALLAAVLMFVGCTVFVRLRAREVQAQPDQPEPDAD